MAAEEIRKSGEYDGGQTDEIRAGQEYGIDVAVLIDNLNRSPAERIRRHQIALETVEQLRKAKRL